MFLDVYQWISARVHRPSTVSPQPRPSGHKVDVADDRLATVESGRPRPLSEDEACEIYDGFECFITDINEPATAQDFVRWCMDGRQYKFVGWSAVWRAYELCCLEIGKLALPKTEFSQQLTPLVNKRRTKAKNSRKYVYTICPKPQLVRGHERGA